MVYGVIVAGGQGVRIGFRKQYTLLAGKPMWRRSAEALLQGGVERLWLVVPEDDVNRVQSEVAETKFESLSVVPGGATRFASVQCGLRAIVESTGRVLDDAWVAVHDAARPFVRPSDVEKVIAQAKVHGGAILGVPCSDTVKRVEDGVINATVPRSALWLAQTPQVFSLEMMMGLYFSADMLSTVTDDASVFEAAGYDVHVVHATGENRKITTPEDIEFAAWLADKRWGEARHEP